MMLPTDVTEQHVELFARRHLPNPRYSHSVHYKQARMTLNIKEPSFAMEDLLNIPMVCLSFLICHKGTLSPPFLCAQRRPGCVGGATENPCVAVSKQLHVGGPLLAYKGKGGRRLSPRCLSTVGPCDCVTATSLAQNDLEGDIIHLSLNKHQHPAWLPRFFPPSFSCRATGCCHGLIVQTPAVCPSPSPRSLTRQHFLESLHLPGLTDQGPTHSVLASLPGGGQS